MSSRRVKITLLCEDSQHEAFVRRFLKGMGWNTREIRVEKSPAATGSAEQWVRETFPKELEVYRIRSHKAATGLIAVIDADTMDVQDRINEFKSACISQDVSFRTDDETVAIIVPKRNIESWIYFLNDQQANEEDVYPKLKKQRECSSATKKLVQACRTTGINPDALPSLQIACEEYRSRISPLRA